MKYTVPKAWLSAVERGGYWLVLLPFVTEWLEEGHFNPTPRENLTELIAAALIFTYVVLLNRARRRREALERARTDLLQLIVHDIKNPISSAMSAVTCLIQGIDDPGKGQKLLNLALNSCRMGLSLVERILELERLETDSLDLRREPVHAEGLLSSCSSEAAGSAMLSEITLSVEAEKGLPDFAADPDLLRRALMNLLENAMKHTPFGGSVALRAARRGGFVRLAVTDTGTGIPPEKQKDLFQKFHRLEAQSPSGRPGTGLGLYFCRLVAEAHEGRVELESQPGKGTTVALWIPLQPVSK